MCACARVCSPSRGWYILAVFDVSIRGLSPSNSTLPFDLHQSGPDHSAFVYFQRHFPLLRVSPTRAPPRSRCHTRCVCECWYKCRFEYLLASEQMCVRVKTHESGLFYISMALGFIHSLIFLSQFEQKHISSGDFPELPIIYYNCDSRANTLLSLCLDACFHTLPHSHFCGKPNMCLFFSYFCCISRFFPLVFLILVHRNSLLSFF